MALRALGAHRIALRQGRARGFIAAGEFSLIGRLPRAGDGAQFALAGEGAIATGDAGLRLLGREARIVWVGAVEPLGEHPAQSRTAARAAACRCAAAGSAAATARGWQNRAGHRRYPAAAGRCFPAKRGALHPALGRLRQPSLLFLLIRAPIRIAIGGAG